jgi:hypothetical protein
MLVMVVCLLLKQQHLSDGMCARVSSYVTTAHLKMSSATGALTCKRDVLCSEGLGATKGNRQGAGTEVEQP